MINGDVKPNHDGLWIMDFYEAFPKDDYGVGAFIFYLAGTHDPFSFILDFECTNNVREYEALVLCLETNRKMGIKILTIVGYFELVINQVKIVSS
jgi:ribonuclease HI